MEFILTLHDKNGVKLNEGDIVLVTGSSWQRFYSEVKYLPDEHIIAPFHTFSFHQFEKVDKVPDDAVKSNCERYNYWYVGTDYTEVEHKEMNDYLMSWLECERLVSNGCFQINLPNKTIQKTLF